MRLVLGLALGIAVVLGSSGAIFAQEQPTFKLGFKDLADQIPDVAGQPLEAEHWGDNGDSLQRTSTGLMVWRKADNWTAFTNGSRTWLNGPEGAQDRANDERFEWEGETTAVAESAPLPTPTPQPSPTSLPTSAPTTATPAPTAPPAPVFSGPFTPDVKAMDAENQGPGAAINQLVQDVNKEWAASWKWQPRRPVTIYLYADPNRMFWEVERITGVPWPAGAKETRMGEQMFVIQDPTTGGWAELVAFKGSVWGVPWTQMQARYYLMRGYALVMLADVGAKGLPVWFSEGVGQYASAQRDGASIAHDMIIAASEIFNSSLHPNAAPGLYPTLRQLTPSSWNCMVQTDERHTRAAYGMGYLAVKRLADRVGTEKLAQVIQATSTGESFDSALQRIANYTIEQLDSEYRGQIPRAGWENPNWYSPLPSIPCGW